MCARGGCEAIFSCSEACCGLIALGANRSPIASPWSTRRWLERSRKAVMRDALESESSVHNMGAHFFYGHASDRHAPCAAQKMCQERVHSYCVFCFVLSSGGDQGSKIASLTRRDTGWDWVIAFVTALFPGDKKSRGAIPSACEHAYRQVRVRGLPLPQAQASSARRSRG